MNKSNIFKTLSIVALFIFGSFTAHAQLETSVYFGGNVPTADFNKAATITDSTNAFMPIQRSEIGQNASCGLNIGFRASYRFNVGFGEVAPYINADLMWNQLKRDTRDAYTLTRSTKPQYFNVPIYAGLNYRYALTEIIKLFGELGIGYDLMFITANGGGDIDADGNPDMNLYRYRVKNNGITWQVGAGAYFDEHVSAGIHYYGLGQHQFEYAANSDREVNDTDVYLKKLGALMLRVGFHF